MTNIRTSRVIIALYIVVFPALFFVCSCAESTSSGTDTGWVEDESDLKFQSQSNNPPTTRTLCSMAEILAAQGRDSECEYVLKRIIQDDPKYLPAYNKLAELQMRKGQTNSAIETLQHGLSVNPDDTVLLNNLGMCWIVRHDYENALKMFTKAAGLMPENVKYRANMAVALGLMGRDDESLSLFKQILPEEEASHNLNVLQTAKEQAK